MEGFEGNIIKLDEEFKHGLKSIRTYLVNLTSPHDARSCGEWLQRLRDCTEERELRNVLLQRLTSHVQQRRLEYPFDRPPPNKPLYTIYEEGDGTSWCTEESSTKGTLQTSAKTGEGCVEGVEIGSGDAIQYHEAAEGGYWYELPDKHTRLRNHQPRPSRIDPTPTNHWSIQDSETSLTFDKQGQEPCPETQELSGKEKLQASQPGSSTKPQQREKNIRLEELGRYVEDYKSLLTDYKRVVNENITDLSERLDSVIESNQNHKTDMIHLQDSLHSSWNTRLQSLESDLLSEVSKLETQLASDRTKYEAKIEHLKQVILEKDDKINCLDTKIKEQAIVLREKMNSVKNEINLAAKENEESYKKKYAMMRKEVLKLESINRDLIKQYEMNTQLTIRDYETKVKQAKLQGADESMAQLESKINQLEKHYHSMFLDYKNRMDDNREKQTKIRFDDSPQCFYDKG